MTEHKANNPELKRFIAEDQEAYNLWCKAQLQGDWLQGSTRPPKPKYPSFWGWVWSNPDRFKWFTLSVILMIAALIAELTAEGIMVSTKISAEQAAKPAVILFAIAVINLAFFARTWRTCKYSHGLN